MKIFLTSLLLIASSIVFTQSQDWIWALTTQGQSSEYVTDILIDKADNFIVTGDYFDGNMGICNRNFDSLHRGVILFIAKYTKSGKCMWAQRIGSPFGGTTWSFISLDSDNNIYLVGGFSGSINIGHITIETPLNKIDGYIAKFNPDGIVQWVKEFKGDTKESLLRNIVIDENNLIYIVGHTNSKVINFDSVQLVNNDPNGRRSFIIQLDQDGNVIWGKLFKGNGTERAVGIAIDNKNNVVISGYYGGTFRGNSYMEIESIKLVNSSTLSTTDLYLAKFNSNGDVLWAKSIGGVESELGGFLEIDSKNNIYLTGTFQGPKLILGKDTLMSKDIGTYPDYFLAKFDQNGQNIWARSDYYGTVYYGFYDLAVDSKDNVYIHLIYNDKEIKIDAKTFTNNGKFDNLIIALDENNNTLWAKSYGSISNESASSLDFTLSGELIITGTFDGPQLILGNDTLINEGKDVGFGITSNLFIAMLSFDSITSVKIDNIEKTIRIFPNPAFDEITLELDDILIDDKNLKIDVLDVNGKIHAIDFRKLSSKKVTVDVSDLQSGVYLITVKSGKLLGTGKVVILHN